MIGIAGGERKCRYVKEELGFDDCRDHRAGEKGEHVGDPVQAAASTGEPTQEQRSSHQRDGVPDRLAEHRPPRSRKIRDQEVARDDPGPQPPPPDHERCDADALRRSRAG